MYLKNIKYCNLFIISQSYYYNTFYLKILKNTLLSVLVKSKIFKKSINYYIFTYLVL